MAPKLPPLNGLRLFEAAARCSSFKRAAQELNLTPGALSHGIDALEQWLDVELFEPRGRNVVLTTAGRQYLPCITKALSMIATGTLRLRSRSFENRLSISSCDLFAHRLLLPRLHKFREAHPNTIVTVDASSQVVQLPSDQFDLAVRTSRDAWPNLSCDLLGRTSSVPVAAPSYIQEISRGGAVDWSRTTLIHNSIVIKGWERWCDHTKVDVSSAGNIVLSNAQLALEAAIAGLGIALGAMPLIHEDITAGRLAIAVDAPVPARRGFWLVRPHGADARREVVAFRNWLLEELSQLSWGNDNDSKVAAQSA
jgi:LysR family transcriptional regulator, glycine cleavage system transcriptional activator